MITRTIATRYNIGNLAIVVGILDKIALRNINQQDRQFWGVFKIIEIRFL